jgi:hypothetical protein
MQGSELTIFTRIIATVTTTTAINLYYAADSESLIKRTIAIISLKKLH